MAETVPAHVDAQAAPRLDLPPGPDWPAAAARLLRARRTVLPKRLGLPGPGPEALHAILAAAADAPDHGQLLPWRFVLVPSARRQHLADVFEQALLQRDAAALPGQRAQAREKAHRAPLLLLLVVDGACGDPAIGLHERIVSAGCAVQNVLLAATAAGFGSGLTSGQALQSPVLREAFGLGEHQHPLCFVSIGTALAEKPPRLRPDVADYLQVW